ncbi:hypothetical protein D9M72_301070 [compost metagenome]
MPPIALDKVLSMSDVARLAAPARASSMSTANCGVSSRLLLRTFATSGRLESRSMSWSRAFTSASWPSPLMSFRWKLKPALAPSPRTAGGSSTKMRASRMVESSLLARRASSAADWPAPSRSAQSFSFTKARAELWSPFCPVITFTLTTSGCLVK